MNWRKPIIKMLCKLRGIKIIQYLDELKLLEKLSPDLLEDICQERLDRLLQHARKTVPYYKEILDRPFEDIPFLTKDIIRQQGTRLYSSERKDFYENYSGGSTGEPVPFLQDRNFKEYDVAVKLYYNWMNGVDIGVSQIKLWGSLRDLRLQDIKKGRMRTQKKIEYWLFNIRPMESFVMSDDLMAEHVKRWNRIKPRIVWSYLNSLIDFGRYLERTRQYVFVPDVIVSCAEPLTDEARSYVQDVYEAPVVNLYGSREVGDVACECRKQEGLHVFNIHNKVEIIDKEIYITNLHNYSMPLIRYKIGDAAEATDHKCSCGRSWPLIKNVTGRVVDSFKTMDGKVVYGDHIGTIVWFKPNIKQFQVIQKALDHVQIKIVPDGEISEETLRNILEETHEAMGDKCNVDVEYVKTIKPAANGKYRYAVSEIK